MNLRNILLLSACAFVVTGCTTASLKELRRAEPSGSPFYAALAAEYLRFAESEATQYDWIDSKYFADKGLLAVYGNALAPEELGAWDIPKEALSDLEAARKRLVAALTEEAKTQKPEIAANALYAFDCWVEQQEENWQKDDIAACRDQLFAALGELAAAAPAPAKESAAPASDAYIVFFDWNKADLTDEAQATIAEVIRAVNGEDAYNIVLNGHADASGSDEYNITLSEKRVTRVRQALVDGGVKEKAISVFAFGESDPRQSAKGGKEKANRRVEIFIND